MAEKRKTPANEARASIRLGDENEAEIIETPSKCQSAAGADQVWDAFRNMVIATGASAVIQFNCEISYWQNIYARRGSA